MTAEDATGPRAVELTPRQRLDLAYLCAEGEARAADPATRDAAAALLIAYVLAESITPEHFAEADRLPLMPALLAAGVAAAGVALGLYSAAPPDATGARVVTAAQSLFAHYTEDQ